MSLAKTIGELTKKDSIEKYLVTAIKSKVKAVGAPRKTISKTYKPSWIHGCKRKQVFLMLGYETDGSSSVNPESWFMGQSGSRDHKTIQELLWNMADWDVKVILPEEQIKRAKEMGINTEISVRQFKDDPYELMFYNKDYNISGKSDGIFAVKGKIVIFEYKNEDYFKFQRRFGPEPDHIKQAACYSLCLGVNHIIFLYHDRNYKVLKPYMVEITDIDRQNIVDYIRICNDYVGNNILPVVETDKCKYCSFTKACKKEGPERKVLIP